MKNVTVKALVHSLIDLIDEGSIHLNDTIISAELTRYAYNDCPPGTLNLLICGTDPNEYNMDVNIYTKEMKEENQ